MIAQNFPYNEFLKYLVYVKINRFISFVFKIIKLQIYKKIDYKSYPNRLMLFFDIVINICND